jgi:hypothetical protein
MGFLLFLAVLLTPVGTAGYQGDGVVDNAAFNAAVAEAGANGGKVIVPAGLWELGPGDTALGNPFRQYSVLAYNTTYPVTIECEPGAVIRMVGNGGGGTWAMFGSENQDGFHVENCFLDGSGRTGGYAEHQHLVKFGYGSKNVSVTKSIMFHPTLGDSAGGDCISTVGGYTQAELVERLVVDRVWGVVCDRSFLLLQRSVRHAKITNSGGYADGDQVIDSEASDAADPFRYIYDVTIDNFLSIGHGGLSAQFGRGARIRVQNSAFLNGTVTFQSCRDCSLDNVEIQGGYTDNAVLYVRRAEERLTVFNSHITRPLDATINIPLVQVTADMEGQPIDLKFIGNRLLQTTADPGFLIHSGQMITMLGNTIEYAPTTNGPNAVAIVLNTTITGKNAGGIFNANYIKGVWKKTAIFGGNSAPVIFSSNIVSGPGIGIECSTGGPIVTSANVFTTSTGAPVVDACMFDVPQYP